MVSECTYTFFGASLAAGSDTATRALIGWSNSGTGLSRCSCQTWLTAVARVSIQYCSLNILHALSDTSSHVLLLFHQKHLTELTDRSLSANFSLPNMVEVWTSCMVASLHGCIQIIRNHYSSLQTALVCLVFHPDAVN